ncbi:MAG: RagB/SusD family nutrient uptake outer membrane protein [Bacteroidota bacterium]
MKKRRIFNQVGWVSAVVAALFISCTDLEIEGTDSIISEESGEGFTGLADAAASLDQLYTDVGGNFGNQERMYGMSEVASDELLVPTRGTDWGDNGIWRAYHNHTWDASHGFIQDAWNNLNQAVFRASEIIDSRTTATNQQRAEAKFLRALNMYFVMDLWGQIPFREVDEGPEINPRILTPQEAYDFILGDLNEALPDLATIGPGGDPFQASKATANFLLAKLYLNGDRYTGTANYAGVISAVDAITADGYALEAGYFNIFEPTEDTESVFVIRGDVGTRIWNTLHYNLNAPDNEGGGWNGFATLAEIYDLFEGDPNTNFVGDGQEERRGFVPDATTASADNLGIGYGFLIGQQYEQDGTPLTDRPGAPLVFTKDFPGLVGNNERTGVRVIKYHPSSPEGSRRQHMILFRYADAHLMKAEATLRSGGDALAMVNELRTIRNASPLGTINEDELLDERVRELYAEYWRRNDLLRYGQFTKDWPFKDPAAVGNADRNLFPIPAVAILSNPNLVQNPGY